MSDENNLYDFLEEAIDQGDFYAFKKIIAENPTLNLNAYLFPMGGTLLIQTISRNQLEMAEFLLKNDVNIEQSDYPKSEYQQYTPLLMAVERSNVDMVRMLLNYGANPIGRSQGFSRNSPLHLAVNDNDELTESVRYRDSLGFIEEIYLADDAVKRHPYGGSSNPNERRETGLKKQNELKSNYEWRVEFIRKKKKVAMILMEAIKAKGLSVDIINAYGATPLVVALAHDNLAIAEDLLRLGASPMLAVEPEKNFQGSGFPLNYYIHDNAKDMIFRKMSPLGYNEALQEAQIPKLEEMTQFIEKHNEPKNFKKSNLPVISVLESAGPLTKEGPTKPKPFLVGFLKKNDDEKSETEPKSLRVDLTKNEHEDINSFGLDIQYYIKNGLEGSQYPYAYLYNSNDTTLPKLCFGIEAPDRNSSNDYPEWKKREERSKFEDFERRLSVLAKVLGGQDAIVKRDTSSKNGLIKFEFPNHNVREIDRALRKYAPFYEKYNDGYDLIRLENPDKYVFKPDKICLYPVLKTDKNSFLVRNAGCNFHQTIDFQLAFVIKHYNPSISASMFGHWGSPLISSITGTDSKGYESISVLLTKIIDPSSETRYSHYGEILGDNPVLIVNDEKQQSFIVKMDEEAMEIYKRYSVCPHEELESGAIQSVEIPTRLALEVIIENMEQRNIESTSDELVQNISLLKRTLEKLDEDLGPTTNMSIKNKGL